MEVTWAEMKILVDSKGLSIQSFVKQNHWFLHVVDGSLEVRTVFDIGDTDDDVDRLDFELNYLPTADGLIDTKKIRGGTDGTEIGNVGDRLKVDTTVVVDPSSAPGCPILTNKLQITTDIVPQNLPINTNPFLEIYSYTGSGKLVSFLLLFNTSKSEIKLVIDTNEIFIIALNTHKDVLDLDILKAKNDSLEFEPHCPIQYNTKISLFARSTDAITTRQFLGSNVNLTKET